MADIDQSITGEKKLANRWLVLVAVILGTFIAPLDASIVNTVLPEITSYFQTDISIVQWVPTIYLLTISCVLLLFGRLGDMFGHKRIFLYGVAGFTVASVLCGASQSIWMLIASRAIQGLSASMLMAVGYAIIVSAFPPTERGKVLGILGMGMAAALSFGPTLGGLIAEYLDWRYVFFINVPIGITAVLWGARIIPSSSTNPGQRLDFAGAVTATIFLLCLLLYGNKGESWGWTSPLALSLLGVAVVFIVLFYRAERRSAQPMLDLSIFSSRRFNFAILSALLGFMAHYMVIFLAPFFLAVTLHYSIISVGLVMAASPVGVLIMSPISGTLSDRFGIRIFTVCGMCMATLGLFLFSQLDESATAFDVAWRLVITSSGIGMFQAPNNSAIMGSVSPKFMGITGGVISTMRNLGMVSGVAVAGAVLYTVAPVAATLNPDSFTSDDIADFMSGLQWAFLIGTGLACLAALTSFMARDRKGQWA